MASRKSIYTFDPCNVYLIIGNSNGIIFNDFSQCLMITQMFISWQKKPLRIVTIIFCCYFVSHNVSLFNVKWTKSIFNQTMLHFTIKYTKMHVFINSANLKHDQRRPILLTEVQSIKQLKIPK